MQIERLRSLIRESIQEHIKEIETVAEAAAMEARLAEYDKAIKMCEDKIAAAENLEEIRDLVDDGKINELKKKLKTLTKTKEKLEKQKAKKNKGGKEVTTDAETDKEEMVDETYVEETEENVDEAEKQTFSVNNLEPHEKHRPFKKLRREEPGTNRIAPSNQTDNEEDEPYNQGKTKNQPMDETMVNESFLKMQKLAGVITETQYNQKKKALVENQVDEAGIINKVKGALGFKDYSKDPGVIYAKKMIDDYVKDKKLTPDEGKKVLAGITGWIKQYLKDLHVPDYFEIHPPNDNSPDGAVEKMWFALDDLIKKIAPNSELNKRTSSSSDFYDDSAIGQQSRIGR